MLTTRHRYSSGARQHGMSLVELMVGITVGLFVVAAATMLVSTQLADNRKLLIEAQLQQDLRSTADIITRELRRMGAVQFPEDLLWAPTAPGALAHDPQPNPNDAVTLVGTDQIAFRYYRRSGESGPFGFKLEGSVGTIKTQLSAGNWSELTDPRTLNITSLIITPINEPGIQLPCPKLCADGTPDCWPSLVVRAYQVSITGVAVSDPAVQRTLQTTVRTRNDQILFNDALNPTRLCPA